MFVSWHKKNAAPIQERRNKSVLPLSFMHNSHYAPQPHQTMCYSVTGVPVHSYLKFTVSAQGRVITETPYFLTPAGSSLCRWYSAFLPVKAFYLLLLLYNLLFWLSRAYRKLNNLLKYESRVKSMLTNWKKSRIILWADNTYIETSAEYTKSKNGE